MMTTEQIISEAFAKAVDEATGVAIQAMAEAPAEQTPDMKGPKIGGPTMKHPTFDWDTEDKYRYSELKTFRLEVNNILSTYNTPQTDKLALVKNWLQRKGLLRDTSYCRKRNLQHIRRTIQHINK